MAKEDLYLDHHGIVDWGPWPLVAIHSSLQDAVTFFIYQNEHSELYISYKCSIHFDGYPMHKFLQLFDLSSPELDNKNQVVNDADHKVIHPLS
jgi:hypothetical protein